jgi:hypothetical protein
MVEIDDNRAENAMRPIALGRKNWMQIGNEKAGPKIAAILSVLETCKRLGVKGSDPRVVEGRPGQRAARRKSGRAWDG